MALNSSDETGSRVFEKCIPVTNLKKLSPNFQEA
jgi:hypothetical protein